MKPNKGLIQVKNFNFPWLQTQSCEKPTRTFVLMTPVTILLHCREYECRLCLVSCVSLPSFPKVLMTFSFYWNRRRRRGKGEWALNTLPRHHLHFLACCLLSAVYKLPMTSLLTHLPVYRWNKPETWKKPDSLNRWSF